MYAGLRQDPELLNSKERTLFPKHMMRKHSLELEFTIPTPNFSPHPSSNPL